MKTNLLSKSYIYEFNGVYYFRKKISKKYLVDATNDMIFRRSFKKICSYYLLIKNNNDKIVELARYINENINFIISVKGQITLEEISKYIYELCEDYAKEAKIENSHLEDLRVADLEYINANGNNDGHTLQALAKEWKELNVLYNDLSNKQKVRNKGIQIVKRSNISKDQILKVPPEKLDNFYEMLIKAEKQVIENDLRLYISRNQYQFTNLLDYSKMTLPADIIVEQLLHKVLNIIDKNPYSENYLTLMNEQSIEQVIATSDRSKIAENTILNIGSIIDEEESVETYLEDYFNFKTLKAKRNQQPYRYVIRFFNDFLKGEDDFFEKKKIVNLTDTDIQDFCELFCNLPIGNKKYQNMTLYELNELRIHDGINRMMVSTMSGYEANFKAFWEYLSKQKFHNQINENLKDNFNAKNRLTMLKEIDGEVDSDIVPFKTSELNKLIYDLYNEAKLKVILRDL